MEREFERLDRPQNKRRSRRAVWRADTVRDRSLKRAMGRALKPRAHKQQGRADVHAARLDAWAEHLRAGGTIKDGRPYSREEHNPPPWDPYHVAREDYVVYYDTRGRVQATLNVQRCTQEDVQLAEAMAERRDHLRLDDFVDRYGSLPDDAARFEPEQYSAIKRELGL